LLAEAPPEWERTADPGPLVMSAVTRTGTAAVIGRLAAAVRSAREEAAVDAEDPFVIHRPEPVGFRVVREDDGALVVLGRPAERAVALNDLTNIEAIEYVQSRLKKLGVDKALARAGAVQGDTVRIGRFEFEYEEDE
jgi:GTP-binding protein